MMSRRPFVAILVALSCLYGVSFVPKGFSAPQSKVLTDVPRTHWAYDAIQKG